MNKKIVCVSLSNSFGSDVSKIVANSLDMFFLDIDKNIEYEFSKMPNIFIDAPQEYIKQKEQKIISNAMEYENTLFFVQYETFVNNLKFFENCCIIYFDLTLNQLKLLNDKNFVVNSIAYEDRKKILQKYATFVKCDNLNKKNYAKDVCEILRRKQWL